MLPTPRIPDGYAIDVPHAHELAALPAIELEAARLLPLADLGPALRASALPLAFFESAADDGRLWVARTLAPEAPVGFAALTSVDATPHLHELDVLPAHGRRGLGRALVLTAAHWAAREGFDALTLTTFRHISWNAPFYTSLGFEEIAAAQQGAELRQTLAREARDGLDPAKRVAMRLALRAP